MGGRALSWLLFLTAVTWHLWWVAAPPDAGAGPIQRTLGRDFATYYYAADTAIAGADPWSAEAMAASVRTDGARDRVHPWLYPPPALLVVAWAPSFDLGTASRIWCALQELCLLGAGLILALWWRPLGPAIPVAIAGWIALTWGVPYGLVMGQINPLVLLLVIAGLALAERDRPLAGGALMGAAVMVKMSPVLFVGWWALQRRWTAVTGAAISAVALSLAALPLAGASEQVRFYTQVLPGFASGDYNGLAIRIGMFANHSLPNLADQLLPGDGSALSPGARALSAAASLLLIGGLGWLFRQPNRDPWRIAGQASSVALLGLLVPVYTYEHHLILAIPAAVLLTAALVSRRLPAAGWLVLGLAAIALGWPHPHLKGVAEAVGGPLGWGLQELKTLAIAALLAVAAAVGADLGGDR